MVNSNDEEAGQTTPLHEASTEGNLNVAKAINTTTIGAKLEEKQMIMSILK